LTNYYILTDFFKQKSTVLAVSHSFVLISKYSRIYIHTHTDIYIYIYISHYIYSVFEKICSIEKKGRKTNSEKLQELKEIFNV